MPVEELIELIGPALRAGQAIAGVRGYLAAAGSLTEHKTQEELLSELEKDGKVKVKTKTKNNGTKVLKFSDAIVCVEKVCESNYASSFVRSLLTQFKQGLTSEANGAQLLAQAIVDCMEKKLLEQLRKRSSIRVNPPFPPGRPKSGEGPAKDSYPAQRRAGAGTKA